jgi:hypothetical protein
MLDCFNEAGEESNPDSLVLGEEVEKVFNQKLKDVLLKNGVVYEDEIDHVL